MPLANHTIVQAVLQRTTGLPEDVVTNTFHFRRNTGTFTSTAATAIAAVIAFYNDLVTSESKRVAEYINGTISRTAGAMVVKAYDGALAEGLREPVEQTWTLAAAGAGSPLPAEVSACLSFEDRNSTTVIGARRRGRIYVGPLTSEALAVSPVGDARLQAQLQAVLRKAADQELGPAALDDSLTWCVFSPTDNALRAITHVWTDNAFDIQRRRGVAASSRAETILA